MFPVERPRRLRDHPTARALVQEVELSPRHLILPLFVVPGEKVRRPIPTLPGHDHLSPDEAAAEAARAAELGVRAVLLFGLPRFKDPVGSDAWADDGPVQEAVRAIRRRSPETLVITDVCLCEYTDHGHCGVLKDGKVLNDATLPLLARVAESHARAGAHWVAPSDMMDGRVGAIRKALDEAGFPDVAILSYAAKFASALYGPFRDAAQSAPREGDRRGYQLPPANRREALREVALDIAEGADLVMVKPALPYLDIIAAVRSQASVPVVAYQVSGEYAWIRAAAAQGYLPERETVLETLLCLRRAGADLIITYYAREAAAWLQGAAPPAR